MGKTIRKSLALVIALMLCMTLGLTAFAAEKVELKVNNVEGHTYTAYQLFVGDLADDKATLSNVKWGENAASTITYGGETVNPAVGEAVPGAVLEYLENLGTANDGIEQGIANVISDWVTGQGTVITDSGIKVETGYYVVKDEYTNPDDDQTTTLSTVVCEVVGPTTITPKAGTTEHKKEVLDINDTNDVALDTNNLQNVAAGWDKSADHDFGDKVPFKLTTTIASDFAKYNEYYLAVHDTLKDGLKLDKDSIKVVVAGNVIGEGYNLDTNDQSFKVEFTALNKIAGAAAGVDVVVYYTATLDAETAVIGNPGNWNESYAEFSNNPNGDQEGHGETPRSTAVVFTYKTDVDKLDGENEKKPLKGAEFTLTKTLKDGSTSTVAVIKYREDGVVTTNTADGTATSEGDATKFSFRGIDDGTYTLTETVTPNGYNTIDPITFVVSATHDDKAGITDLEVKNADGTDFSGEISFTATPEAGAITTGIENNGGSTLPSTGGMGTTIFYIIGGVLVLAAAIVLISKRRVQQ